MSRGLGSLVLKPSEPLFVAVEFFALVKDDFLDDCYIITGR